MLVKIPFKDRFDEKLLNGKKSTTARTKRYGGEGDEFERAGGRFKLMSVTSMKLIDVASCFWDVEGFDSMEEFIEFWKKIHPGKGYVPEQRVFLHVFERVA